MTAWSSFESLRCTIGTSIIWAKDEFKANELKSTAQNMICLNMLPSIGASPILITVVARVFEAGLISCRFFPDFFLRPL
jgi:hypothetical protein